jgi:hypothetical protein
VTSPPGGGGQGLGRRAAVLAAVTVPGGSHSAPVGLSGSHAGWLAGGSLPRALDPVAVAALLGSCALHTEVGRRDFAIMALLARSGLRAGEMWPSPRRPDTAIYAACRGLSCSSNSTGDTYPREL